MSHTLKLLHTCNHISSESSVEQIETFVVRSSGDFDIVDTHRQILEILLVCQNRTDELGDTYLNVFEENVDFLQFTHNKIKWFSSDKPVTGSSYKVIYNARSSVPTYDAETCPICSGNGWYVDTLNRETGGVTYTTGLEKLAQQVIKFLLSEKVGNYGTMITSLVAKSFSEDELTTAVEQEIMLAESNLIDYQAEIMSSTEALPDDEQLSRLEVVSVELDPETTSAYLTLELYSVSGDSYEVSLRL